MARMTQAVRDQATRIHDQHANAVDAAMNNPNLSLQGQRLAVARAQLTAQQAMSDLQNNFQGGAALTANDLVRRLFGADSVSGVDAISVRDANDRASQLDDPEDAAALMNTAHLTGDTILAKAIARQAFAQINGPMGAFGSQGWSQVLDTYAQDTPGFAEQLQNYRDAMSNSLRDNFDQMIFMVPTPSVIADIHPERLGDFIAQNAGATA